MGHNSQSWWTYQICWPNQRQKLNITTFCAGNGSMAFLLVFAILAMQAIRGATNINEVAQVDTAVLLVSPQRSNVIYTKQLGEARTITRLTILITNYELFMLSLLRPKEGEMVRKARFFPLVAIRVLKRNTEQADGQKQRNAANTFPWDHSRGRHSIFSDQSPFGLVSV